MKMYHIDRNIFRIHWYTVKALMILKYIINIEQFFPLHVNQ